jgi:CHAT domain-containing protein
MIAFPLIACLGVFLRAQAPVTVDSLRTLAAAPGDSALVSAARAQPDSLRAALARTLALAASPADDVGRATELRIARRLAAAWGRAWADPFFLREVARFEAWAPARRAGKVAADSLRRAGIIAYGRHGAPAAMKLWRASLDRALAARDSAGIAASLVTVGAGFYYEGQADSATAYLARGRDLAATLGDHRTAGNALGILASVHKDLAVDLARAAELYAAAAAVRARTGDTRGAAADQNNLGTIAQERGDLDAARDAYERALALHRRDGRRRETALALANLAGIATTAGDYARAQSLYQEALAINRAAGDLAQSAFVLADLGRLATRRGDYPHAHARLSEALRIHESSGASLEAIGTRQDLAAIEAAMGDLQSALVTLRRAERDATGAGADRAVEAALALASADLSVQLGTFADAQAAYDRAESVYRAIGDEHGRADAQHGRGLLLLLRDDHEGALRVLDLAVRGYRNAGDRRSVALTELVAGHVQREQGDTAAARRLLTDARVALRSAGDVVGEAAALHALGELAAARGTPLAAESLYRSGLERLGERPAPDVRWRLHAALGEALARRGSAQAAADELRRAIALLERVAGGLRVEDRRAGFMADKWETWAALARIEHARGRTADAFDASERMRARQMLDMLARGRIPAPRPVMTREQDLRRHIAELTTAIEQAGDDARTLREPMLAAVSVDAARAALDRAQREYAALLLEMREHDPAYAALVANETVPWRAVAGRLRDDEVFLEYLVMDSTSLVFVVTRDTVAAIDLDVGRRTLARLVDFSRRTIDRREGSAGSTMWRAPLVTLQRHLIDPVERAGFLGRTRTLIIAPHAELHFLSFASLLAPGPSGGFLVERFQLAYAPSATAWVRLAERRAPTRTRGVLALAPRIDKLPASRAEVDAIRTLHGRQATALTGPAASERALREAIPRHGILHLATFGVLNKHNPLFSFVELSRDGDDDGRLEVHEVFGLDLAGQLVVLSACQTALGSGAVADVPAGDDWVGLVQAFLHAGAGSVLASLWPVDDRATAQLMERFHRGLASGESETAALAEAQRAALRDPRTAKPFYWAGFSLSGTRAED